MNSFIYYEYTKTCIYKVTEFGKFNLRIEHSSGRVLYVDYAFLNNANPDHVKIAKYALENVNLGEEVRQSLLVRFTKLGGKLY